MLRWFVILLSIYLVRGDCRGTADIVFAIPGNGEIPGEEFFPFEKFLTMLVDYFTIDVDNINVGLILYGREPIPVSWPQPMKDQTQTNTRITLLSQRETYNGKLTGRANITAALQLMQHMFRNPSGYPMQRARLGAKQIGVLFTYGPLSSTMVDDAIVTANEIKDYGVDMYTIGRQPNGEWFERIATNACNAFALDSFSGDLRGLLPYIGSSICTAVENSAEVTAENCFPEFWSPSPNPPITCPSMNAIFQDPYNCAYLFKCDLNIPVRERCPTGMIFDNSILACNHKDAVSCFSMITCPEHQGLFPHPEHCNRFLNCFDNIPYVQSCPNDLYFNSTTKLCDERENVRCRMH